MRATILGSRLEAGFRPSCYYYLVGGGPAMSHRNWPLDVYVKEGFWRWCLNRYSQSLELTRCCFMIILPHCAINTHFVTFVSIIRRPVLGKVPLFLVGGLRRVTQMEEIVEKQYADGISMSRPFIREPGLINRWKAEQKNSEYINYDLLKTYRDFGGIRLEDDVLVTETGHRILGKEIPKTISDVEDISSC